MRMTQKEKIINYIQKYGSITSWEAYRDLGITQFATRVKELKEKGYRFKKQWEIKKDREGKKVKFKRYYLLNKSC
ncbi:MAG: hypothetical protein HFJ34_08275 [Clostridia bacterium]|nr:hypothetical protein [Clostridia bacterium]